MSLSPDKRFHALWAVVLFLCAACATTNPGGVPNYTFSQLQEMGEKFLAAGDIPQAIKFLTLANQKRPGDPVIVYDLGLAYGARGLYTEAQGFFEKALVMKPDYSEAANALGAFFAERGDLDKAKMYFRRALENPIYQTPYLAMFNLGRIYERESNPEAALEQYREAIRLQPSYAIAYFRMGQILETMRRGDEAKEAYAKAIQYDPNLIDAHLRYGIMSYMAGELENALYSLTRVVKLAPPLSTAATEAKRYLEKLQAISASTSQKSAAVHPPAKAVPVEVIAGKDLRQETPPPAAPPSIPPGLPQGVAPQVTQAPAAAQPVEPASESQPSQQPSPAPASDAPAASTAPPAEGEVPVVPPPEPQWLYIVQAGTFIDKATAEEMQQKLKAHGYKAVIKSIPHQVMGKVFVVQLKPVSSMGKASTLVVQLENEEQVKPVIIKVPVNEKR